MIETEIRDALLRIESLMASLLAEAQEHKDWRERWSQASLTGWPRQPWR